MTLNREESREYLTFRSVLYSFVQSSLILETMQCVIAVNHKMHRGLLLPCGTLVALDFRRDFFGTITETLALVNIGLGNYQLRRGILTLLLLITRL